MIITADSGKSNGNALIAVWNAQELNLLGYTELPSKHGVQTLCITEDKRYIVAITNDRRFVIYIIICYLLILCSFQL